MRQQQLKSHLGNKFYFDLAGHVRREIGIGPGRGGKGNESIAADFLAGVLQTEGIAAEIVEAVPGRGTLVARLPAAAPASS